MVSEILYTDHGSDFTSKHLEQVEINLKIKLKLIAINSKYHAFNEHVKNLSSQHNNINFFVCYEKPNEEDKKNKNDNKESYIDLKWIQSVLPTNKANFYFCGPIPFIKATNGDRKQWNVHEENIHSEFFGPSG